ncbi:MULTISPECIES: MarR family winged helix-turn-helix transcriptional regulator [Labrys]|jgi:DNA-binding MarR family transcriptional regulator|uniref:MarR family winged helix-turn-helix transcriptional regulator n=1 Tax=Labrys TaxID=204476 RepID=UPI0008320951|nr:MULTISPECIES: MarR family transcriptional regulator [unclassified Labrys (in: a-proteobacteria)]MDZ5452662.1 MarR family transcriptional regulator [Labrys sp. ZIDIC5]OCC02971.1 MarR family transcriptional regulator [Labrys sp. WJW]
MDRADTAVEQWARERPDLPSLPMAVFGRLSDASERVLRDHMNPLFAAAGLQPGEFDVLATLRRSGEPYMLSPTRLYEAAMISSGGMTNRLDRLEHAGLVERRPDPNDRRGKLIALTEAGKAVIDETIARHVANEERLLSVLTQAEQESLNGLLRKLITAL